MEELEWERCDCCGASEEDVDLEYNEVWCERLCDKCTKQYLEKIRKERLENSRRINRMSEQKEVEK